MRISQVYLLMMTSAMVAAAAPPGNGQSIETTVVSLEVTNEPLRKVFQKIESQTDFLFAWNKKVNDYGRVTLTKGNYTVKNVLDIVLKGTGLKYEQDEKYILVTPVGRSESVVKESEVESGGDVTGIYSAALVTGTVRDAGTQEPLAGVNIIVKGTTRGTTTDVEGKFGIEAEENDVLVFSFIGFETFEAAVGGRANVDVAMNVDVTALKEVEINAGYWKVAEREKTGNISRVTAKEIESQPVSNPLQALQGRMPGVYIAQSTGLSGGAMNIQIRGQSSLRTGQFDDGNQPLYVIDGVPFPSQPITTPVLASPVLKFGNPLNSINAANIESIEILKDADATAIYGSRGANGVVLITTKKGKDSKTKFDLNVYRGAGEVTNMMDLLNTGQYLEMRNEAFANDAVVPSPSNPRHKDVLQWGDRYTNWQDLLIGGTANVANAQATFSGGSSNTHFLFSSGFYKETPVTLGDFSYRKASGSINVTHSSSDQKLTMDVSSSYTFDHNNLPTTDPTIIAVTKAPNAPPLINEDGSFNWEDPNFFNNPIADLLRTFDLKTNNFIGNVSIGYQVIPSLVLKVRSGFNTLTMDDTRLYPASSNSPALGSTSGSSDFSDGRSSSWILEPQIEFKENIGKGHLTVLMGTSFQETVQEREATRASGFPDDNSLKNIRAAGAINIVEYSYREYRYNAVFSRINYNWREKYIVNLTGRRDGSSRFGPNKKFGNFGAIGVAWVFSNEKIIASSLPFISFGKLRTSYGITGNDQIPDYQYLDTYQYTGYSYLGKPATQATRLSNPEFSWEVNKKWEGAVELGFFMDKILFSASYYRNRSSNQLVGYSVPAVTGFSSVVANFPAIVENTGVELELTTVNISTNGFNWTTSLNFTLPRNKLVEYPDIKNSPYAFTYDVGKSLFVKSVFQNTTVDLETGMYGFDDLDGNGLISPSGDRVFKEARDQQFFGGFQNTVKFKGIELNVFFQFVKQTGTSYITSFSSPPGFPTNQHIDVLKRWQTPGDIANVQKYTQQSGDVRTAYQNAFRFGDNLIVDASFIRLKNMSLAWTLPYIWSNKVKLNNVRIYFQGQNLITITDFKGLDPENSSYALTLPPLRMYTLGFQITI